MPIVDVILACLLRISRLGSWKPSQDFPWWACSEFGLAGHLFIRSAVRGAPLLLWRQLPPAPLSRGIRRSSHNKRGLGCSFATQAAAWRTKSQRLT